MTLSDNISVLVVDDEYWVRENMRRVIDWDARGFVFLEPASDGEDALARIKSHSPNIVFADVNMPRMTGIELAEKCAVEFPEIVLVAFSGYDDYKYVRGIMLAGAVDYLLKPIKPIELISALNKASEKLLLSKETAKLRQLRDSINTDAEYTQILYDENSAKLSELELEYAGFSVAVFSFPSLARESGNLSLFTEGRNRDIKRVISDAFRGGAIAVFRNTQNPTEYILLTELPPDAVRSAYTELHAKLESVGGAFKLRVSNYHFAFAELAKAYKEAQPHSDWGARSVIPQIRAYIDANYFEEINLQSLSEKFGVESTYLSKLFSQETGETLMAYLTNKRVEKAKEFLANTRMSVNRTSEAVGYSDYAYFGRVFKKITGLTPGQYREGTSKC